MIALIVTIAPMVKGILIQSLYEGQRGAGGVGTGEVEEGPTAPCALTGGLEPGLGLGMGCADGGFGSNANIKVNDSNNDNVVIRWRCPIPPSLIGSIPGPVPPNRSFFGRMYLNTATTVTSRGRTQKCTVVPSLPRLIDGNLWQGMAHIRGGI